MTASVSAKQLIVVLGMHRSGTSAITRGLQALGVNLGENLMPPKADNEKGFWEDLDVNQLNFDLLRHLNCDWHTLATINPSEFERKDLTPFKLRAIELLRRKIQDTSSFGIKDPRIALLLPLWKKIFKHLETSLSYLTVSRNPISVARSIQARNGLEPEYTHYLWLQHIVPSVLNSAGSPRVVVDYDLVIENPIAQLHRIAKVLDLRVDATAGALEEYSNAYLEERLRHSRFHLEDLHVDPAVPVEVREACVCLDQLARDVVSLESPNVQSLFSRLAQRLNDLSPIFGYIRTRESLLATLKDALTECETRLVIVTQDLAQREDVIASQETQLATLQNALHDRGNQLALADERLAHRDVLINAEHEEKISNLHMALADPEGKLAAIASLNQALAERDHQIAGLNQALAERDHQIAGLNQAVTERDQAYVTIEAIRHSRSWLVTAPLRRATGWLRRISEPKPRCGFLSRIAMAMCTLPATFFHYKDLREWIRAMLRGKSYFVAVLNQPNRCRERLGKMPRLVRVPVSMSLSGALGIRQNGGVLPSLRNMYRVARREGLNGVLARLIERTPATRAAVPALRGLPRILVMDYRIPMPDMSAGERRRWESPRPLCLRL
jgi:hypothetical protein